MIDRFTWDEADLKVKSLTYFSLGTEATRIFHQRNPHTMIDQCSTNELVYELGLWQISINHCPTKPKREPGDFLQQTSRTRFKSCPGESRRRFDQRFFSLLK